MSAIESLSVPLPSYGLPGGSHHAAYFYVHDSELLGVLGDFLAEGLGQGENALVVATPVHCAGVMDQLRQSGFDPDALEASGRLTVLDARELLGRFMVDGWPDPAAFQATVGALVQSLATAEGAPRLRIFGEMVDLLWRDGQSRAAIRLEELWNDLQRMQPFRLLCAYVMANFYRSPHELMDVCGCHTHVHGNGNGNGNGHAAGASEGLSATMQAPHALAQEILHRAQVESALRDSLRELRNQEQALRHALELREEQERRSQRLIRVTAAIADAITPEQVYEAVVDQVATALGASSAGLWMLDEERRMAVLARDVGYRAESRPALAAVHLDTQPSIPVADAMRTAQPLWIQSQQDLLAAYPHLAAYVSPSRRYRISCLPIIARGKVIGGLGFTFDDAPALAPSEQNFLMLVAGYCAQALERLRLLEGERRSRERAELLYRLAAGVINAERLEDLFQTALDGLESALGAHRSSILAFDADGIMRFKGWRGLSDEYRSAVEGHSPWGRDAKTPEPIICTDIETDPSMEAYRPVFRKEGIRALGFIPLVAAGQLIGKFMVYYAEPRIIDEPELAMARAIANHVAAAIARFASIEELRQTVHFNEMFTGMLGHDLRNPLGGIMTAAQLALMRGDNERVAKPLSRILSAGARMARMIDQLLDFTRVRVGAGIPIHTRRLDAVPILRQIIEELDDASPDCTLRLHHVGDSEGIWDGDRLSQVFSNLVANAVQHGEPEAGVDVWFDGTEPDSVRVDVHNAGAIAEPLRAHVFEPMTGGDRRRDKSQGLGLGLFISQQICRAHGGRIEVRSSADAGTTFTVLLPRTAASREA